MHTFAPHLIAMLVLAVGMFALAAASGRSGPVGFFNTLTPAHALGFGGAPGSGRAAGMQRNWRSKLQDALSGPANIESSGGGGGGTATRSADEQILDGLGKINSRLAKLDTLETNVKEHKTETDKLVVDVAEVQKQLLAFQKSQMRLKRELGNQVQRGRVSDDCARHLGAIALIRALRNPQLRSADRDTFSGLVKDILNIEVKTALGTGDIPLPTEYDSEIVEFVQQYGRARQYGTVFPLGAATVKLPQLTTDPVFGLIAMSGTVTEKSPQIGFVTFTPDKFGGLIRLPSEIDADSIVAIGQFIARYAARNMARIEDTVFFSSDGSSTYGSIGSLSSIVAGVGASTVGGVVQLASTKTHFSDATLTDFRNMRIYIDDPALENACYYMHRTWEPLLTSFNTSTIKYFVMNDPAIGGPTLDGIPVKWVSVMPRYSTAANAGKVGALFGDLSYAYLGVRGAMRFDTSLEAAFATDEILIRALERFTMGLMASTAVSGLQTAAS
jgi:HK97 family phage major capsid protein